MSDKEIIGEYNCSCNRNNCRDSLNICNPYNHVTIFISNNAQSKAVVEIDTEKIPDILEVLTKIYNQNKEKKGERGKLEIISK